MKKFFDTVDLTATGKPLQNATVRVLAQPDGIGTPSGDPATIYTDANGTGTETTGEVVTDENGYYEFYAPNGVYTFVFLYGGASLKTITDVEISEDVSAVQLAASTGASLVGYGIRTVDERLADEIWLSDFGTGADAMAALVEATSGFDVVGGIIRIPRGLWTLPETFTYTYHDLTVQGSGKGGTQFVFNPASADTAFEIHRDTPGGSFRDALRELSFVSSNSVDKVAISLVNTANVLIDKIAIPQGSWEGSNSKGLQTFGRQSLHFTNSEIACARPVVFSQNPAWPSLNTDHYLLEHLELIGTSTDYAVIEAEDGVSMSNLTVRNCAIVGGKYGFHGSNTTNAAATYQVLFQNFRTEQATDAAGWSFYLASTSGSLQTVKIENGLLEGGRKGIYISPGAGKSTIVLDNLQFAHTGATAAQAALEIVFGAATTLIMRGCTFETGATVTLTNARRVFQGQFGNSLSQRGAWEIWIYDDGGDSMTKGSIVADGMLTSKDITLADGATYEIATSGFIGYLEIFTSEETGARFFLPGTTTTASERDDPYGHFSNAEATATSSNVYWDAGTSRWTLKNRRGSAVTYNLQYRGRAA